MKKFFLFLAVLTLFAATAFVASPAMAKPGSNTIFGCHNHIRFVWIGGWPRPVAC
jgi:hypothetical protein